MKPPLSPPEFLAPMFWLLMAAIFVALVVEFRGLLGALWSMLAEMWAANDRPVMPPRQRRAISHQRGGAPTGPTRGGSTGPMDPGGRPASSLWQADPAPPVPNATSASPTPTPTPTPTPKPTPKRSPTPPASSPGGKSIAAWLNKPASAQPPRPAPPDPAPSAGRRGGPRTHKEQRHDTTHDARPR